ncbi:unnamed protein product [Ilex paraguariensis]|uniref:C2 domain-containing protein n=1 Tax=Ilex paraguariensis TaxID=185542 RepID=A0ABC8TB04_9AQUA
MECKTFEIKLISATNLSDVREKFKMKVYAEVTIAGNAKTRKRTLIDKAGETNPTWNVTMQYMIGELAVQNEGIEEVITLYCKRKLGDRFIGEVRTPIKQLYEQHANANGGSANILTRQVQSSIGISQGELKFSFGFGETVTIERPSRRKKMLTAGAVLLLNLTISTVLGQVIEIPLFMDAGRGVDFMIEQMIEKALPVPEFVC